MYVLVTFSSRRPEIASCHIRPYGFFSFPPPKGAYVMWKTIMRSVKMAVFTSGILGSIITFCMSTATLITSSGMDSSQSFRYSDRDIPALFICLFYSLQSEQILIPHSTSFTNIPRTYSTLFAFTSFPQIYLDEFHVLNKLRTPPR